MAHNSGKQSTAELSGAVEGILAIDVKVKMGMHKVSLSVFVAGEKEGGHGRFRKSCSIYNRKPEERPALEC